MLPRTSKPNRNRTSRKPNPPATSSASTLVFNVMDLVTPPEAAPMASYVDRASADGRSIVRETVRVAPPSPLKRARLGEPTMTAAVATPAADSPASEDRYTMAPDDFDDFDNPPIPPLPQLPKILNPKRLEPSDKSMNHWMRLLRDIFLMQLLRRDGCGDASSELCPGCGDECCLDKHVEHPLHVISEWNGIFFAKTLLRDLGLRIQFGHAPREACGNPQPGYSEFVCCTTTGSTRFMWISAGWYPATDERPQTAATFLVLDKFHVNTLQAKMTAYDFYTVLERLTDNAGIKPPNRYQIFLRMARQWRHLLMLKRAGRGHDPSGVWGTHPGELAVDCPVCPNPKINLPESWENAPPEDRFLYILFIALDACFRLKRRMISSEIKDPGLGTGWAYVTENPPYRHYLLTVTEQKEMSTCSGLAALDYANTKFSRGYSTTGVGMGVCARHEFVQANGVGDLQKGERFANMDYIFGSILRHKDPRIRKIISYDIVCQWWKYLMERMQKLPPLFSLNLVPGSGQTDGEGIERPWASIGAIASSTRVSGPGARHDALDDHWSFWNWLKTIGLPALLRRRLDNARKEAASQRAAFEAFSLEQIERVPVWKKMIDDFEKDPTKRNPYELKMTGLTEMEVRLQFAKEEEEDARKGVPALHDVSPSGFVTAGLELEEQQCVALVLCMTLGLTVDKATCARSGGTEESRVNNCNQRIRRRQYKPSPSVPLPAAEELAENVPLMLPSSLTAAEREDGGCARAILEIENSLREAQCRTALPRLRYEHPVKNDCRTKREQDQAPFRKVPDGLASAAVDCGGNKDKVGWPQLKKEDIRCMQDAEELSRNAEKRRRAAARREQREDEMRADGLLPLMDEDDDEMVTRGGENVRQVSWIWTMAGTAGTEEELEDALRIEWSKAWARSRRWTEEVRLLEEEWRRLPLTYEHRERLWKERAVAVPVTSIPEAEAEGMIAYALKQAQLYRDLAARAETTRTEAKLARGKKRATWEPTWDPLIPSDTERRGDANDEDGAGSDDEEDDERGDIDSDEELLMGGEVDD
ncbi:hypothetical protein B0H14DRAFT_3530298 [Mycena olivaceomarginata]|nr:hypothetical protein B0H14DRAFT_3530298 [Mycena olivaceomarginata]